MRVGYTLWFCVKCSACVQKYMSTVWIDVRGWFCPSVPSSHSIPPSSYHRIIYTRTYFLSFLILSSEIPQIPILIVLHPNDDVLKTLMVGNQLLAGRPDPDHAIPYHTRPRPVSLCRWQKSPLLDFKSIARWTQRTKRQCLNMWLFGNTELLAGITSQLASFVSVFEGVLYCDDDSVDDNEETSCHCCCNVVSPNEYSPSNQIARLDRTSEPWHKYEVLLLLLLDLSYFSTACKMWLVFHFFLLL